ncbi:ammonium transporter [Colletotrichum gloeosporioides Cg-14]|uniref:Ammonium transporter n=2 Tax=Colletotrichum gloeosporioides TaxID=474922 RepID=T0M2D9_COLGC|nr:ammonium permease [Colletotrichum gloeosporioides]EQB54890.1 ammonium transporter [Colletotrichum gloeosporioides Cg-14]
MSYSHTGAPAEFNGTNADFGGDSTTTNLNQWYQSGDQSYILVSAAMVLLMIPGIAFLYSGLARRKSALSQLWVVMMSFSVIVFQWYFWGYSLAFSETATNGFIGDLRHFGLMKVLATPSQGSPLVPALLYSFYQMMFCAVTAALVAGATAERGRVIPCMVFIFFWATLVYSPVACWAWNANGWAFKYGVLDYAGGGPVEIGSGMSALAYSWVLGRRNEKMMLNFRPHNISLITLGTILLWFGWLGFNGGSAFGANLRAAMACWNSCLTAMFAAMTWCLLDFRLAKKWSLVGWCSGTISGLVAATPASGVITPWASIILGVVAGVACNFGTKIKFLLKIDDSLDVFAEHGIGGIVGLIFNAFFASGSIIGLDGVNVGLTGGWVDGNWKLMYIQIAYIVACCAYTFVMSALIAKAIDMVPGLRLRASEEAELLGMDDDQHGEFSYDYVEVRRDFLAWTPHQAEPAAEGKFSPQHGIEEHQHMANNGGSSGSDEPKPVTPDGELRSEKAPSL